VFGFVVEGHTEGVRATLCWQSHRFVGVEEDNGKGALVSRAKVLWL
jgi:hypothetical protein